MLAGLFQDAVGWWVGLAAGAVLFSAAALVSPRHARVVAVLTAVLTACALGLASVVTFTYLTVPIVIGPLTVYCVALALKYASASYAHAIDPPRPVRTKASS